MRINMVVYAIGFVDHTSIASLGIESRRNSQSAFRSRREEHERCGRITARIVYCSERDAFARCHLLYGGFQCGLAPPDICQQTVQPAKLDEHYRAMQLAHTEIEPA